MDRKHTSDAVRRVALLLVCGIAGIAILIVLTRPAPVSLVERANGSSPPVVSQIGQAHGDGRYIFQPDASSGSIPLARTSPADDFITAHATLTVAIASLAAIALLALATHSLRSRRQQKILLIKSLDSAERRAA